MKNPFAFFASAILAVVLSIPLTMLFSRMGLKPAGRRLVEEARRAGRVVQGTLTKSTFIAGTPGASSARHRNDAWLVTYTYTVQGQTCVFRGRMYSQPPQQIALYYDAGKPHKAVPEGLDSPGGGYALAVVLPLILWVVLFRLLGG